MTSNSRICSTTLMTRTLCPQSPMSRATQSTGSLNAFLRYRSRQELWTQAACGSRRRSQSAAMTRASLTSSPIARSMRRLCCSLMRARSPRSRQCSSRWRSSMRMGCLLTSSPMQTTSRSSSCSAHSRSGSFPATVGSRSNCMCFPACATIRSSGCGSSPLMRACATIGPPSSARRSRPLKLCQKTRGRRKLARMLLHAHSAGPSRMRCVAGSRRGLPWPQMQAPQLSAHQLSMQTVQPLVAKLTVKKRRCVPSCVSRRSAFDSSRRTTSGWSTSSRRRGARKQQRARQPLCQRRGMRSLTSQNPKTTKTAAASFISLCPSVSPRARAPRIYCH
mmetsp:Transcript_10119/g.26247  ORF Transcript_10119/g.26247 Transcript_10119/m.26247 type:complete len:334 (+) Transcript_10119:119-1120(+)